MINFIIYFPKQNLEKISLIISSVTTSPVIFPKSSKISFINIAIIYIELQIQFDNVIRTSNQVNP